MGAPCTESHGDAAQNNHVAEESSCLGAGEPEEEDGAVKGDVPACHCMVGTQPRMLNDAPSCVCVWGGGGGDVFHLLSALPTHLWLVGCESSYMKGLLLQTMV